jgi:hypothetical protein
MKTNAELDFWTVRLLDENKLANQKNNYLCGGFND